MRAIRRRLDPWQAASDLGPARIARWWRDIEGERHELSGMSWKQFSLQSLGLHGPSGLSSRE